MTPALQPYPAHKLSGVEWLGNVPVHWEVRRLKYTAGMNERSLAESTAPDYEFSYLEIGAVGQGVLIDKPTRMRFVSSPSRARRVVRDGDTLLSTVRTYLKASWFAFEVGDKLVCSTGFAVLTPKGSIAPRFLGLLVRSENFTDRVTSESTGTAYPAISENQLASLSVPLPPLLEQRAIVRYLDYVDRRIRRYVSAKQKLIALLEEEKQAIINQAVTRGLDPNVRLKPSGVEWLGDMPEHWTLPRLRNLGDALIGLTYDPQDVVDEADGLLVLRASNILNGQLVYGDTVYVRSAVPSKLITQEGDILICSRSGIRALIGKNARIDAHSAGTTFGAFMTVFRGPHNDYVHQVFNSKFFEYQSAAFFTSTINQLTLGILYDMKVPFPPSEERQWVLRYLQEMTASMNEAISASIRQIELAQEYQTRLISDVVTGKLDVREAADSLPHESDDLEPIDEAGLAIDGQVEGLYDPDESVEEFAMEREVTA